LFEGDEDLDLVVEISHTFSEDDGHPDYLPLLAVVNNDPFGHESTVTAQQLCDLRTKLDSGYGDRLMDYYRHPSRERGHEAAYRTGIVGALLMRVGAKIRQDDMNHLQEILMRCEHGFMEPGRAQFGRALAQHTPGKARSFREPRFALILLTLKSRFSDVAVARRFGMPGRFASFATTTSQLVCCLVLIQQNLFEITMCTGPSMLPTFSIWGDLVLVEYVTWKWRRKLDRGDVVVAVSPLNPQRYICKRLVGLPGDPVEVNTITGKEIMKVTLAYEFLLSDGNPSTKIPPGHVWLLGDNPKNSTDSREYGPVPMGLLRGRILLKVFPEVKWMAQS
ncbi:IMP1 inner mitochondrial membrane peptidase-like, partial [Irineochytrium annulatum]